MAGIENYKTLEEKKSFFSNFGHKNFIINEIHELNDLIDSIEKIIKDKGKDNIIFRGVREANYKLYNSGQRYWINNQKNFGTNVKYSDFIMSQVSEAKKHPLLANVFKSYDYKKKQKDIAILSLFQHYNGLSPLLDWTYNLYIGCYFAVSKTKSSSADNCAINDYSSLYMIDLTKYPNEFLEITQHWKKKLTLDQIFHLVDDNDKNGNFVFYISDFQKPTKNIHVNQNNLILGRHEKPLTTVYNQNIIPQEGLFIFNPSSKKPLEDAFKLPPPEGGNNLHLSPFECYNIHKGLSEYLKRKLRITQEITKGYVFPNLNKIVKQQKEKAIDKMII